MTCTINLQNFALCTKVVGCGKNITHTKLESGFCICKVQCFIFLSPSVLSIRNNKPVHGSLNGRNVSFYSSLGTFLAPDVIT